MPAGSLCEREPIHSPGAIQMHGALLAVLADGGLVSHASANLPTILGRSVESVLGRPLANAIGEEAGMALLRPRRDGVAEQSRVHFLALPDAGSLYLHAFQSGSHVCIDIEPLELGASQKMPMLLAQSVLETFRHAGTIGELCELAVHGLRSVTGFDRVMAYRFAKDGHGDVVAEALAVGLEPYLGLRYPATDIPPQARRLYVRQRVGAIADSSYQPVPLVACPALERGEPLDLTNSVLRSVSPVHCEYMRNMNTAASLTVALIDSPDLWGMLVCHHSTPHIVRPEVRAVADTIGQVVSLLLASLGEAEVYADRLERNAILRDLTERLATPVPLANAFAAAQSSLLRLVDAPAAVLSLAGTLHGFGATPPLAAAERALALLRPLAGDDLYALDDLCLQHPELAECISLGSGALALALPSGPDDAIVWFRPELTRTVTWGGNPTEHGTLDSGSAKVSPRRSFAAWKETVNGRSEPWTPADLALARALRHVVEAEGNRRTRVALLESEAQLGLVAEHSGVVVALCDPDGTRRYVSPTSERVLGWRPEDMVGRNAAEFVHPDDHQILRDAAMARQNSGQSSACYRHRRPDGSWLWVDGYAHLRMRADGAGAKDYVIVLRDATERKAAEDKMLDALGRMERMAATDGLTGLANRRHFDGAADREWRRCVRDALPLSVLLLDVDQFKRFNDRYGHLAGDDCLRAISAQLTAVAHRPGDLAARYGGEEFVLLLPNTGSDAALQLAERLRALVQGLGIAHETNARDGVVSVSIGAATAWPADPRHGAVDVHALLAAADAALYRAKGAGRNRVAGSQAGEPFSREDSGVDEREASEPATAQHEASAPVNAEGAYEALTQFLYRAPIGLIQTTLDGTVEMINPMSVRLLLPLSRNGDLDNLFATLDAVAPQLRESASAYRLPSGTVCESIRIALPAGAATDAFTQVLSISLLKLDETRLMASVSDVTLEVQREQSALTQRLDAESRTDSLTRMPNRAVLREFVQGAIERSRADAGGEFAVLFLNCDRFKQINDSLGHAAGDEVLRLMAERLCSALRQRNRGGGTTANERMAGRLGGDEFVVLLDELHSADEVHAVAQRLIDVMSQPYGIRTHQLHISVSMGVVLRAQVAQVTDADTVLRDASIAMVEAKRAGGGRYVIFETAMQARAARRGAVEIDLRRALAEKELFVVYQPVVALQQVRGTKGLPAHAAGVEALVRWRHPTRGIVQPVEFVGVAEECGLIGALGEFVLETACRQFVEWQRTLGGLAPRLLAVNLSRGQLGDPGLLDVVSRILDTSGMPPARLQLEVTESLAAQDEAVRSCLEQLESLGLTLALDDFGTGYSSLASLHQLPVGTVKIDRSFVSEAVTSAHHRVLIEATVRVASSLGMGTVAEGIETEAQAELVRQFGCEKGQGYFFSKPLSAENLVLWLNDRSTS